MDMRELTTEKIPGCGNWRLQIALCRNGIRIRKAVTADRNAVLPEEIGGIPVVEIGDSALKPEDPRGAGLEARTGMNADVWEPELAGTMTLVELAARWRAGERPQADCFLEMTDGRGLLGGMTDGRGLLGGMIDGRGRQGETTDGRSQRGAWSNRFMESIVIPSGVHSIGHYAFLGCDLLRRIELYDGKVDFGTGVFMNCPLTDIWLHRPGEEGNVLSYFAYELTRELDARILGADGEVEERVLFPEYFEVSFANVEARQFDYDMVGIGYPYHHVFRSKKLDWHEYDRLWERCLAHGTEEALAGRIAWFRLRWPVHLSEMFREPYVEYLKQHAQGMLLWCIEHGTAADLSAMAALAEPSEEARAAASEAAREAGRTDCLAVLMAKQTGAPAGRRKKYEL